MEPTYYVILNFSYSEYLGSEDERARISSLPSFYIYTLDPT